MRRTPAAPRRRSPIAFWFVGGALVLLGLWGFNHIVQANAASTARKAAVVASHVASKKLEIATESLRVQSLAGCKRGNLIRMAVNRNTTSLSKFERAAEIARSSAARADPTAKQRLVDQHAAAEYRQLRISLRYTILAACEDLYPKPLP